MALVVEAGGGARVFFAPRAPPAFMEPGAGGGGGRPSPPFAVRERGATSPSFSAGAPPGESNRGPPPFDSAPRPGRMPRAAAVGAGLRSGRTADGCRHSPGVACSAFRPPLPPGNPHRPPFAATRRVS
jgi:hypothetical protein